MGGNICRHIVGGIFIAYNCLSAKLFPKSIRHPIMPNMKGRPHFSSLLFYSIEKLIQANITVSLHPAKLLTYWVLISVFIFFVMSCTSIESTITPFTLITPTNPTITSSTTPSLTNTRLPTYTATTTSTPSNTIPPSRTPTGTPLPSLTPAFPVEQNEAYSLVDWTPALADRLVGLLEAYPDTLSTYTRREDNSGYYAAFSYAILAQQEALLRFPDAPQADDWLWGSAYNLAQTGDPSSGAQYAFLIVNKLNEKAFPLAHLPEWISQSHPEIDITITPLKPQAGYLSSNLVDVRAGDHGSAVLWLLETTARFIAFPLTNDFDFIHSTSVSHFTSDFTGDGIAEVVIYRSAVPESLQAPLPQVFDLSQRPPRNIPIAHDNPPQVGPEFVNQWIAKADEGGKNELHFITTVFPPCPVTIRQRYIFDGRSFNFTGVEYTVTPDNDLLGYCDLVITHAEQVWGLEATINIMEQLLPYWPPAFDDKGKVSPPDAIDKFYLRLGVFYALNGNQTQATSYLSNITSNPALPAGETVDQAFAFLAEYQTQRDIYRACQQVSFCNLNFLMPSLVATISRDDYPQVIDLLREAGVVIQTTGYFDFDEDGITERWFVTRQRSGMALKFWMLVLNPKGISALFVTEVDTNRPSLSHTTPVDGVSTTWIKPATTFTLTKEPANQELRLTFVEPPVVFSVDLTMQTLVSIEQQLLSGASPAQMRSELLKLKSSPYFTCNHLICPRFYYFLGLANELAGDKTNAIAAYLEVWRGYSKSPFTTMTRLKLAGIAILPSKTPTPTATATMTSTPTPTRTGTLFTATPTPSVTPSPTQTETSSP